MEKADRGRSRDLVIDLEDPEIETRRKAIEARDEELRQERLRKRESDRDPPVRPPVEWVNDATFDLLGRLLFFAFFCAMCFFGCKYGGDSGSVGVPSRYQD